METDDEVSTPGTSEAELGWQVMVTRFLSVSFGVSLNSLMIFEVFKLFDLIAVIYKFTCLQRDMERRGMKRFSFAQAGTPKQPPAAPGAAKRSGGDKGGGSRWTLFFNMR